MGAYRFRALCGPGESAATTYKLLDLLSAFPVQSPPLVNLPGGKQGASG
jgi:hypothetical protein